MSIGINLFMYGLHGVLLYLIALSAEFKLNFCCFLFALNCEIKLSLRNVVKNKTFQTVALITKNLGAMVTISRDLTELHALFCNSMNLPCFVKTLYFSVVQY